MRLISLPSFLYIFYAAAAAAITYIISWERSTSNANSKWLVQNIIRNEN